VVDYLAIGEALRAAREQRGLSQAAVARKVDVTYQRISQIEQGQGRAPLDVLDKIATAVGLDLRLHLADPRDRIGALLARIGKVVPGMAPEALDMLDGMIQIWERQQRDPGGGRARPVEHSIK
jgi:transcriptional regulator with XRE-family HTH domain